MEYEFKYSDDCLIIRLSGAAGPNERLLAREYMAPHLRLPYQRIIVDLENINESRNLYVILGVLNTIKKEFQLLGGKIKLCCLKPTFYRYLQANRLEKVFDIGQSMEIAKLTFEGKSSEN